MKLRRDTSRNLVTCGTLPAKLLVTVAVLFLAVPTAEAVDWSATSVITERAEVDDNIGVDVDSDGEVYGSSTSVSLDVKATTQRSTLNVSGGFNLNEFAGPGADSDLDSFSQNAGGNLQIRGPRSTFGLTSSFSRQNTTFSEFEDTGVNNGATDRISYSVGGNVSVNVNRSNRLTVSAGFDAVDFGRPVDRLTPFQNIETSAAWITNLTENTDFEVRGTAGFLRRDDLEDTRNETFSVTGRLTTDVTSYLTVFGSGGVNLIHSTETPIAGMRQSDTRVGTLFDVGFDYQVGVANVGVSFSQSVSPSATDGLRENRSVNANLSHRINTISSVSLSAIYSMQTSTSSEGSDRTFARISPTYSVQLSRYWHFGLGYEFRFQDGDDGSGKSNKVFGTLSRKFVLLP